MIIRSISKAAVVSAVAIAGVGAAHAQSSVQCTLGPNGQLEAALVWRNTLGTERADALCRTASIPAVQQPQTHRPTVASVQPQPVPYQYPVQPTIAVATPNYQVAVSQPHPVAPTAHQAVQYQNHAGVQVAVGSMAPSPAYAAAPQQHYPAQRYQQVQQVQYHQMAAAPSQYQATIRASAASSAFNPLEYEPMQAHTVASVQASSSDFVPMFQR